MKGVFVRNRMGDALAHVAGAAAALGTFATGPENVGWPTGARLNGGFDFTIPNGSADADIHACDRYLCRCDLLADAKIGTRHGPVKWALKARQNVLFQLSNQLDGSCSGYEKAEKSRFQRV